ncbi:MAG: hypothetical protein CVU43_16445 [Chloroflexi bacterium HGW-Chloroflexi-5]|jgi:hypothetical protein|nr:MAG: hypothetical protein CVV47_15050 [Spirochaetae bacterium HGW-Spirochaetae-3]PKN98237.1 MAG: hypothetical protein CVU43_16445 [Chloroflexi bacterium HGW-Chloroflexi-5]
MKDLNSVLIEGDVKTVFTRKGKLPHALHLCSKGFDDGSETANSSALITVDLERLPQYSYAKVTKGSHVRIVGRLCARENGDMYVLAEHLELRAQRATAAA